jgi:hypothetical protein
LTLAHALIDAYSSSHPQLSRNAGKDQENLQKWFAQSDEFVAKAMTDTFRMNDDFVANTKKQYKVQEVHRKHAAWGLLIKHLCFLFFFTPFALEDGVLQGQHYYWLHSHVQGAITAGSGGFEPQESGIKSLGDYAHWLVEPFVNTCFKEGPEKGTLQASNWFLGSIRVAQLRSKPHKCIDHYPWLEDTVDSELRRHVEPICLGDMSSYGEYSAGTEDDSPFGQFVEGPFQVLYY